MLKYWFYGCLKCYRTIDKREMPFSKIGEKASFFNKPLCIHGNNYFLHAF